MEPNVLWPPNHKLVLVQVGYEVSGQCGAPSCSLSVTSNEVAAGEPGGEGDWVILGLHSLLLRAERDANGNGRVYTITIECRDTAGNASSKAVKVVVPHDKGK